MAKGKKNWKKNVPTSVDTPPPPPLRKKILPAQQLPRSLKLILCAIVAAVAIALYAGSFNHDFAYDDIAVVQENRYVQKGFDGISDILRTQYFEGYDPNTNARAYRPVSLISYAIEQEYFGLDPKVHHVTNVLLYGLTAIFLLLALLRLLRQFHWSLAFMTTLLFVVHPVHVDVIANIKSRDELMGFLNFSIALLFLLKDMDEPAWWKKALSYVFFFFALASKEILLTTMACIPLLLYFFRDLSWGSIIRKSLPYAGIFVVFLLIRSSVISGAAENVSTMSYLDNPILAARSYNERFGTNVMAMGMFPYKLSCDYSYNSIPVTGIGNPVVIAYLLAYIGLIVVAVKGFKQKSVFSFCILWFFITISIVSSIFIMSSNAYADRFLYTPSLGACLAIAYAIYLLAGMNRESSGATWSSKRILALGILALLVVAASVKTISYVPAWKNDMALFEYNLKVNPNNARMHKNYGGEMIRRAMSMRSDTSVKVSSDTSTINNLVRRGIVQLQKGKAIYPRDAVGHIHEANGWILLGNYELAEKNLRRALEIDYYNRFANTSLGYVLYTTGRYKEAVDVWEQIRPEMRNPSDNYNLYLGYMMLGDQQKANYYKTLSGR